MPPILYSFRRCPYAIRARMALLVSGMPFERREVSLRDKPAELLAASPKGTVPVLVLQGGEVIDQSLDIMHHALALNDPEEWLGGEDAALIGVNDGAFKQHLDHYKYPDRHDGDPHRHRDHGLALLDELEQRLARHDNLCRASRALTDIALLPFVRQFAAVDRDWFARQKLPGVRRWLDTHIASALFVSAMAA